MISKRDKYVTAQARADIAVNVTLAIRGLDVLLAKIQNNDTALLASSENTAKAA